MKRYEYDPCDPEDTQGCGVGLFDAMDRYFINLPWSGNDAHREFHTSRRGLQLLRRMTKHIHIAPAIWGIPVFVRDVPGESDNGPTFQLCDDNHAVIVEFAPLSTHDDNSLAGRGNPL